MVHAHCMHDYVFALQGLVAGLNAARKAQELEPVVVPRNTSYIGTLIDDLVTKVQTERHCMGTLQLDAIDRAGVCISLPCMINQLGVPKCAVLCWYVSPEQCTSCHASGKGVRLKGTL